MHGKIEDGEVSNMKNMEQNKCKDWNWMPWGEIVNFREMSPEILFEPMINLIDLMQSKNIELPSLVNK